MRDEMPAEGDQSVYHPEWWPDHLLRVPSTAAAVSWFEPETIGDPACGDASVVLTADRLNGIRHAYLGDRSGPQVEDLARREVEEAWPFPTTLSQGLMVDTMLGWPQLDLMVLTECLEHVEDPDAVLRMAAARAKHLVASSPLGETFGDNNPFHVWAWDEAGYRKMIEDAGWRVVSLTTLSFTDPARIYRFGIWTADRK